MRSLLFGLILLTSACAIAGQQASPTPTPVELKLEKLTNITAITHTLKDFSGTGPKFEGEEDQFRIRLPLEPDSHKPASWPNAPGDMPTPGRTSWNMVEAEIGVSITPMPPGLISGWGKNELSAVQTDIIDRVVMGSGGRKIYEKEVLLGDLKGKEAKIIARGTIMLTRVFFANDRQYVVGAALKEGADHEALVKATFETFEIVNEAASK